ncbi:hypothetical protein ABW19_dt0209362 [Dactylella cylindrospora]|nr:hypothetical protein ABW19_dt0209362 [Dactylella cylindrospora]
MGIKGLYEELPKPDRTPLAKLSIEHFQKHKRHIKIAIDVAIWSFQSQAVQGRGGGVGSNASVRVLYYRLCTLLELNIHAVFVFDGKDRPDFKRDKTVNKNESYQLALARRLITAFGFPIHNAPGEAEAECAYLQKEGIVDAVLSEDVDTLMFGCRKLWRSGSDKGESKSLETLLVYQSRVIYEKTKITPQGMILVALLSGGDYDSAGVTKLGVKLAVAAAKAGYGEELIKCYRRESLDEGNSLRDWREKLQKSLRTNCERIFPRRQTSAKIPEEFPDRKILEYYINPKVSETRPTINWDIRPDILVLRELTKLKFEWSGSGKLIRTLSEKLLSWQLGHNTPGAKDQVLDIHQRRSGMKDGMPDKIRITYKPIDVVPLPYDHEVDNVYVKSSAAIDAETMLEDENGYSDSDNDDIRVNGMAATESTTARVDRPKVEYDPRNTRRFWIYEDYLKVGAGSRIRMWDEEEKRKREERERISREKQQRADAKKLIPKKVGTSSSGSSSQRTLNSFYSQSKPPATTLAGPITKSSQRRPAAARRVIIDLEATDQKENVPQINTSFDLRSFGKPSSQALKSMKVVARDSLPGAWKVVTDNDLDKYDDKSLDDVAVWDLTDVQ